MRFIWSGQQRDHAGLQGSLAYLTLIGLGHDGLQILALLHHTNDV